MEIQKKVKLSSRFFASLIDYLVIISFYVFFLLKYGEQNTDGEYTVHGLKSLIPFLFWFIYIVGIESAFNATVGHFILGLKVIKPDNSRISFSDSLKRHLLDIIDFSFFGIPAIVTIKNTPLNQRIGDLWAKTIVVYDKE